MAGERAGVFFSDKNSGLVYRFCTFRQNVKESRVIVMKRTITFITLIIIAVCSAPAFAQLEIGASYELRDADPNNGFGVRIEKGFLDQVPVFNMGLRAHFSYFSQENNVDNASLSYSEDLTNYDFGVALTAGISVGLIEPYVGLGLGSETVEIKYKDPSPGVGGFPVDDQNESNIYWNMLVGAKVPIIPVVKPFVEYRYSNSSLSDPQVSDLSTGRIIFGVVLSF